MRTTLQRHRKRMSELAGANDRDRLVPLLLWGTFALFILIVCFVNPFREMPLEDDWAYALSVRHLLETGKYQLHDWAETNMVFQVYWGALFERIWGLVTAASEYRRSFRRL